MKVNYENNNIAFNGFWNNKALKKGLEFAADNGTLFAATTTLALSTVRPFVILATPKTDKKNKEIACSKSLISTLTGYLIALCFSKPLSGAIKKIDKNPEKFLKKETIANLKDNAQNITDSKAYSMATQLFKLGLGFLIAAPKSIITAFGTPKVLKIFNNDSEDNNLTNEQNPNIQFKGKSNFPKNLGKLIDNKSFQDFVKKYKDSNFPLHIVAATDTISTVTFINQTQKNKELSPKEKKPLIFNSAISTILSITSTYIIDHLTKGHTDKIIKKFKIANKTDPKLNKYIEGIKIAKPILIAGSIYYILIPLVSTFLADRIKYPQK